MPSESSHLAKKQKICGTRFAGIIMSGENCDFLGKFDCLTTFSGGEILSKDSQNSGPQSLIINSVLLGNTKSEIIWCKCIT